MESLLIFLLFPFMTNKSKGYFEWDVMRKLLLVKNIIKIYFILFAYMQNKHCYLDPLHKSEI